MAEELLNITSETLTTTLKTLYTAPSTGTTFLSTIKIHNTGNTDISFTLTFNGKDFPRAKPLPAKDIWYVPGKVVLLPNSIISGSTTIGEATIFIDGVLITNE
jgi:hypothetical protein